jgi:hypothetical protein
MRERDIREPLSLCAPARPRQHSLRDNRARARSLWVRPSVRARGRLRSNHSRHRSHDLPRARRVTRHVPEAVKALLIFDSALAEPVPEFNLFLICTVHRLPFVWGTPCLHQTLLCDTKTGVLSHEERPRANKPSFSYADMLREGMNVAQVALEGRGIIKCRAAARFIADINDRSSDCNRPRSGGGASNLFRRSWHEFGVEPGPEGFRIASEQSAGRSEPGLCASESVLKHGSIGQCGNCKKTTFLTGGKRDDIIDCMLGYT